MIVLTEEHNYLVIMKIIEIGDIYESFRSESSVYEYRRACVD